MTFSAQARSRLTADPAGFIAGEIKQFVCTSPDNLMPPAKTTPIWDEPLVGFAAGDDQLFNEYKTIISPEHLTPREALALACGKAAQEINGQLSVICWVLPAVEETRKSNRRQKRLPSRLWSHTRWYGEKVSENLRGHLVELLRQMGCIATAPFIEPYFKVLANEKGLYSNWSERHAAYAAGLGTFSLSDGLITERGIAMRCGSVVTDLLLPPTPRRAQGPYDNCLFYAGTECRACIKRCPAGAISESGHDKNKCQQYVESIGYAPMKIKDCYDDEKTVAGCGLCQTGVPCEFMNPVSKLKKKQQ